MISKGMKGGVAVVGEEVTTAVLSGEMMAALPELRQVARVADYESVLQGVRVAPSDTAEPMIAAAGVFGRETMLADDYDEPQTASAGAAVTAELEVVDASVFAPGDTVLVNGVYGYEADGVTPSRRQWLTLLVLAVDYGGGTMNVAAVNGKKIGGASCCVPSLGAGVSLVRLGSAWSDTGSMGSQRAMLPGVRSNVCQRFAVEVSADDDALRELKAAGADWTIADMVRVARNDLLRSRDMSLLFGAGGRVTHPGTGLEVCLAKGLWSQAGGPFLYNDGMDAEQLAGLVNESRSMAAGAKVLLAGTELWSMLETLGCGRVIGGRGGIEVVACPLFDEGVSPSAGLVVTRGAVVKCEYQPLRAVWNAESTRCVVSECSCLLTLASDAALRVVQS